MYGVHNGGGMGIGSFEMPVLHFWSICYGALLPCTTLFCLCQDAVNLFVEKDRGASSSEK